MMGGNNNDTLRSEILVEFQQSIANIQQFGRAMEELDSRFGTLEQRVDAMRNSMVSLNNQTTRQGMDIRNNIERQLNNLIAANGVVVDNAGNAPFRVREKTLRSIYSKIDSELNRVLANSLQNINFLANPVNNQGVSVSLGQGEFDAFNKEVARLVRTQVSNLTRALRANSGDTLSSKDLAGLEMNVGRETVKQIIQSIKRSVTPILMNPQVQSEGVVLQFNQRDLQRLTSRIKNVLSESLDIDLSGMREVKSQNNQQLTEKMSQLRKSLDGHVTRYIDSVRMGVGQLDVGTLDVPMQNMSKSLRRFIARDLGTSVQKLEKTFQSLTVAETTDYELRRQFSGLQRTIDTKLRTGTTKVMSDLKRSVRSIEMETDSNLKHHLIQQIKRVQDDIVRKIREQIDKQFAHMRAEIATVQIAPKDIRRSGRMRQMAEGYASMEQQMQRPYASHIPVRQPAPVMQTQPYSQANFGSDPYARREAHFSQFGLEGAIQNTLRHILAGGLVGTPIMAAYRGMDEYMTAQGEQLKIFQNFMLKDNYMNDGEIDYSGVQQAIEGDLVPALKNLAVAYGMDYGDVSRAAAVGSRSLDSTQEVRQFIDYASMIQRLDSEADLAEVVAPGLEAVLNQMNMTVWQADEIVQAMAVGSNRTKATTEDLMQSLQRSAAGLRMSGMDINEATAFNALAIHFTGLSGSDIGNMSKTLATRLTMPTHVRKLEEEFDISVYDRDEDGIRRMRGMVDIMREIGELSRSGRMDEQELGEILFSAAGGFQGNKLKAFVEALADIPDDFDGLTFQNLVQQMEDITMDDIDIMLANTMESTFHNINRAGVSITAGIVSILDELSPEINALMQSITTLANGFREHADLVADVINVISNALIGYAAFAGGRYALNKGGFQQELQRQQTVDRLIGFRGIGGRQEGVLDNVVPNMGRQVSENVTRQLKDRNFLNTALQSATLAPILMEMSNMDDRRSNEFNNYLRANASRMENMEDFFDAFERSRGYRDPQRLSSREVHERSTYNVRQLLASQSFAQAISSDFSKELQRFADTREGYLGFNSTSINRQFTRQLAAMDNQQLKSFETFIVQGHSGDRQIQNVDEIRRSHERFVNVQKESQDAAKRSTQSYVNLSNAVRETERQLNQATRAGQTGFNAFLGSIPARARSAQVAVGNLLGSVGKLAAQLGLFYALGEIITTTTQAALMTEAQQDLKTAEMAEKAAAYHTSYVADGDLLSNTFNPRNLWNSFKLVGGSIGNGFFQAIGEGPQYQGLFGQLEFNRQYKDWMVSNYGNAAHDELLRNGSIVIDGQTRTREDFMSEFLNATGKMDEIAESKAEVYAENVMQQRLAEEEADRLRRESEDRVREMEELRTLQDSNAYFTNSFLRTEIQDQTEAHNRTMDIAELDAILSGVKTTSREYIELQSERIRGELRIQEEVIGGLENFIRMQEEKLRELEELGQKYVVDPETGERRLSEEYRLAEESVENYSTNLEILREEYAQQRKEAQIRLAENETRAALADLNNSVDTIEHQKRMRDFFNALSMDRNSPEYIQAQIESEQGYIMSLYNALHDLRSQDLLDPNDELKSRIRSLEEQIASAEVSIKDLKIQEITAYRRDLERFDDYQEIDYLRAQLQAGTTDSSNPVLRNLRQSQGNQRVGELEVYMANLRSQLEDATNAQDLERMELIQSELLQLEKESLRVQVGMLDELKGDGGTFNLPDGLRVMTEYDWFSRQGTHSQYTLGSGDMNVNITLPNITNATSPEQMQIIAESIAIGMQNGRMSSIRQQMSGGPWGYRTV